ncbi:MAG: RND transporter [Verrucomicrobia bacterium]|nr:RND transporter [Verrucomicrobiota bacterium]
MSEAKPSFAARCLKLLADAIYRRPGWFLFPQMALMALTVWYSATNLQFNTKRDALVGADKQYHALFKAFRTEFPVQDDLVVVAESENLEKNRQFIERLGAYLQNETNLFTSVFYRRDLSMLGENALVLAPTNSLISLRDQLETFAPVIRRFTQATNLVSLFAEVNRQFRSSRKGGEEEGEQLARALPALTRIVGLATDSLRRAGDPPSPGVTSLFEGGADAIKQMYVTMGEGRIFVLVAKATSDDVTSAAIRALRGYIAKTQIEVPGLNVGLTGEPVLEVDEMRQSQEDSTLATIVSLLAVALIFVYGYHETGRPLKATFCLLASLAYTIGFTTLVIGHLNILTITFFPILIGLAIDFGVHLITRYEEELRRGKTNQVALEKAMVNTGVGIFTGALTTAGAFFAMSFTDFQGIREMGIICGGGMLLGLIPMMTMLPALLLRGTQNVIDQEKGDVLRTADLAEYDRRARLEQLWLRHPWVVAGITLALCGWSWHRGQSVSFDYNLLNMQSDGLAAVIYQDKLINSSTRSVLYGAIVANSESEALQLQTKLEALSTVSSVDSIVPLLASDTGPRLPLIREIKSLLSTLQFRPADKNPVDLKELNSTLFSLHGYLTLGMDATLVERPKIHAELSALREKVKDLIDETRRGEPGAVSRRLASYQTALLDDVQQTFGLLKNQSTASRVSAEMLPKELRERFIGVSGKYLLQVYPKHNIWERKSQEDFVRDLRTIVPDATGTPVQLLEYTTLLKDSFVEAAWYSLAAIALLILAHFRRLICMLLALLPVFIGAVWMLGIMGSFGIDFNPANIMTLPLLVGIGVTNGIHIINRYAEENNPSILARSTGKAVLVSGLTTIAGFGSLMLAKHQGIESLGVIMSVGVGSCMIAGLAFLPALLDLLEKTGWTLRRKNPV